MLKTFDYRCNTCDRTEVDIITEAEDKTHPCSCGGTMERTWSVMGRGNRVIGDECDVWVKNGICNDDGSPKRYTSKAAMKKAADEKGFINKVRHVSSKGSDKSKHTTRWY